MKWYTGERKEVEKAKRHNTWQPWFAWFPVSVDGYYGDEIVWLETVYRRMRVAQFCTGAKAVWDYSKENESASAH
jgi:hypothetical protein